MEFSSSYYTRKEKMADLIIPTFSETKEQLGPEFAEVFFRMCPESLRGEMSLESELSRPGKEFWMSPSDILLNKLVLKPPLTERYLKSLTHRGILDIGKEVEEKYFKILEQTKFKELGEQEELLLFMGERQKELAVQEAIAREHEIFRRKLMDLNSEFEVLLQTELNKLEDYLREIYEKLLVERAEQFLLEQEREIEDRTNKGIELAVAELTHKFLDDLENQEKELTEVFDSRLKAQKDRYKQLLLNEQEVFQVILKQLKHNLQCNNIANLMYLLCSERRHCMEDKQQLINIYTEKLAQLNVKIRNQRTTIKKLESERDDKILQCELREICLKNILKQFQKFINFSLRATPTQAEFLLDIKKMMTFQLIDAFVTAKQNKEQTRHIRGIMPWKTKSMNSDKDGDMIAPDYHNCLNEFTLGKQDQGEFETETIFPGFVYKNKLYLSEEFRNKINGFTVKPDSMIWNSDVENLLQLLKKNDRSNSTVQEKSLNSNRSSGSVHFTEPKDIVQLDQTSVAPNIGILGANDSVILHKSIRSYKSHDPLENAPEPPGIPILGALDSLACVKSVECSKIQVKNSKVEIEQVDPDGIFGEPRMYKLISADTIKLSPPARVATSVEVSQICISRSADTVNMRRVRATMQGDDALEVDETPDCRPKPSILLNSSFTRASPPKMSRQQKSILSLHRDSLELLRSSNTRHTNIKDYMRVYPDRTSKSSVDVAVTVPKTTKKLDVNFLQVAKLYQDLKVKEKPWKLYEGEQKNTPPPPKSKAYDNFLRKPNRAMVVGKRSGEEHLEATEKFTTQRVHSFIDILAQNPDLIRIFTTCNQ